MDKKTRNFEISLLNVLFCLLVVFIHVSSSTITAVDKNSWQYIAVMIPWRLSAFVVQGFILLSGIKLFLNKSNNINYTNFYKNRLRLIVIPYIVWVAIYYIYFWNRNYFPFNLLDLANYIFVGNLVSHFYFIIIIIQFYLLTPLWMKLIKSTSPIILILFSLVWTIILGQNMQNIIKLFINDFEFGYSDRIFTTYLFYWIAGCYIGVYYDKFKDILSNNKAIIIVIFFISSICNCYLSYLNFTNKQNIYWLENIHVMYCLSAILFFYMISEHIKNKQPSLINNLIVGFVSRVDKVTYGIYLAHCLVIFIFNEHIIKFPDISIGVSYFTKILVVYTITICGALLFNKARKIITTKVGISN